MSDRNERKFFWWLGHQTAEKEKKTDIMVYMEEMMLRSFQIFDYKGLPDTIPKWALESIVMSTGRAVITKFDDNLYCYDGGWGGEPNVYYRPTRFIVANPYQKFNKNLIIGEDCVLVQNDDLCLGLYPIWLRTAKALTETDISIRLATIIPRMQSIISATDDRTKEAADTYIKKVMEGEISAVMDDGLVESLHVSPYATAGTHTVLTQLMELRTYQLNTFFNEIGIEASTNQKRENVSELEASQNRDYLLPLVDNMLQCRKRAVKEVNRMYGTEIEVDFSDMWKRMAHEIEDEPAQIEKEGTQDDEDGRSI